MADSMVVETRGLSQVERVVDTYVAPGKTFADILRSASWWLPAVLLVLTALATSITVDRKVGFERVQMNQIQSSPKQAEDLEKMDPAQKAQRLQIGLAITKGISYGIPVVILISAAIYALILWACFNFILGGQTTFPQVLATVVYASLPYVILNLLTIVTLTFGGNPEAYDFKMPAGTNLAFFLPDLSPAIRTLLQRLDVIQLWILGLTTYGMAVISRKTVVQSAMVVCGIWVLVTLFSVGVAAATS